MIQEFRKQYHNWMVLYLFHLELEEGCLRMQELNKNLFKELLHHAEENIWMRVGTILIVIGEHMKIEDLLKEEDTKVRMGGHQIEEAIRIEDVLGEGIQIKMGDPLEEKDHLMEIEDPLIMEDPLVMEDPLTMEDPWEMDDILDTLEDKDHQVSKDPLDL